MLENANECCGREREREGGKGWMDVEGGAMCGGMCCLNEVLLLLLLSLLVVVVV